MCSLDVTIFNIADFGRLEVIGIVDLHSCLTKAAEKELAREHFMNSLSKGNNDGYRVGLSWMEDTILIVTLPKKGSFI